MADKVHRANKCGTAKFGPNYNNSEFAMVQCALMGVDIATHRSAIHLDVRYSTGQAERLMEDVAQRLAGVCEVCTIYEEGTPVVFRPLSSLASIGKGSDGEYYGGDHPEWTDAIPTAEAQKVMQQMGE